MVSMTERVPESIVPQDLQCEKLTAICIAGGLRLPQVKTYNDGLSLPEDEAAAQILVSLMAAY
jgi:hypothetical protein